ncbi:hypothetical protein BC937DRAFT_87962 [Endogone sp. FLAS-F59071]|nr:hypothetical protein BC937DRAFT_87962 [Endogone sp. FLAS-F59071]|eukprot:RUS19128.1 hypothetical protein BC937DRAFT_87962 [Endogone sp. FLAS-F59071]
MSCDNIDGGHSTPLLSLSLLPLKLKPLIMLKKRQRVAHKGTPCDQCHQLRRKRSMDEPCNRRSELSIDCLNTPPNVLSPDDQEYVLLATHAHATEGLAEILQNLQKFEKDMEHTKRLLWLKSFTSAQNSSYLSNNTDPPTMEDPDAQASTRADFDPLPSLDSSYLSDFSMDMDSTCRPRVSIPSWSLELTKSGMRINTNISDYSALVPVLVSIASASIGPSLVEHARRLSDPLHGDSTKIARTTMSWALVSNVVMSVINTGMDLENNNRRLYGSMFTSYIYTPDIGQRFYNTYFSCIHNHHPVLHKSWFNSRFYNSVNLHSNPAVIAVCAVASHMSCLKMNAFLSPEARHHHGHALAEMARDMVADDFDDPDIGVFIALVLVAQLKIAALEAKTAFIYIGMATRVADLLGHQYMKNTPTTFFNDPNYAPERETFKRLCWFVSTLQSDHLNIAQGVPQTFSDDCAVLRKQLGLPTPLADEDPVTQRAVQFTAHVYERVQRTSSLVMELRSGACDTFPVALIDRFEAVLMGWYYSLPLDFRISKTLFEDFDKSAITPGDPYSARLLVHFYATFLSVHQQFLPEPDSDSDSKDSEDITEHLSSSPSPSDEQSSRSYHLSTLAASIVANLLSFLVCEGMCHDETGMLMAALDMHLRNSHAHDQNVANEAKMNLVRMLRVIGKTFFFRVAQWQWLKVWTCVDDSREVFREIGWAF